MHVEPMIVGTLCEAVKSNMLTFHPFPLDITVEDFFSSSPGHETRFSRLRSQLAEILQTQQDHVHVFSVADGNRRGEREVNVWFSAHGSPYYKAEKLHGNVAANKAKVRKDVSEPFGSLS